MRFRILGTALLFLSGLASRLFAQPDDMGAYVLTKGRRTLEQIEKIYTSMPPLKYQPPASRWQNLPVTEKILKNGRGELRVVMLGDSIVNDTSRSGWELLIEKQYPDIKMRKITCVRGSTGCWWYKEDGRVKRYVLDHEPDLLIIGGISQRDDIPSIKSVIEQVGKKSKCDILLMTGAFGRVDPSDDKQWKLEINPETNDYRAKLLRLSREMKCAFLDMRGPWGQYIRNSGKQLDWFKRDVVHANERGEQIIGRILARYLSMN